MPNIIEQQDLLKGLPDARLAMLLQNPVADIPPFLVAAEAQRRQALRQQFSGDANKESVVDSLTKQLAKVPQNIQAPAQIPPAVPPTPQMQGVAALQAQQAIQEAAQPQQMRAGGPVQRYQSQGLVQSFRGRQGAGGYTPGEEPEGYGIIPDILGDLSESTAPFLDRLKRFGLTPSPAQIEQMKVEEEEKKAMGRIFPELPSGTSGGMSFTPTPPKEQVIAPISEQAKPQPLPGETEDEYRARLEALFAAQEPSDWEKAQRWFAMAEQFLDPSKTTMQSIAGAGQAFAQSASEQARAQRELDLARQKALLEYDVAERDRIREAEANRAQREFETSQKILERKTVTANSVLEFLEAQIIAANKELQDIDENIMMPPEEKAAKKAEIQAQINRYNAQGAMLMSQSGYNEVLTVKDLENLVSGNQ